MCCQCFPEAEVGICTWVLIPLSNILLLPPPLSPSHIPLDLVDSWQRFCENGTWKGYIFGSGSLPTQDVSVGTLSQGRREHGFLLIHHIFSHDISSFLITLAMRWVGKGPHWGPVGNQVERRDWSPGQSCGLCLSWDISVNNGRKTLVGTLLDPVPLGTITWPLDPQGRGDAAKTAEVKLKMVKLTDTASLCFVSSEPSRGRSSVERFKQHCNRHRWHNLLAVGLWQNPF